MAKEYIEREAALKLLKDDERYGYLGSVDIQSIPTADVVEVVRCKDCMHWHKDEGWCDKHSHFILPNGEFCHVWESADWKMFDADYFCADGERRDNNATD
jgi:hypothetical protein